MSINSYQIFHEKDLGILIFPYLSNQERINLGQADKAWHFAKQLFAVKRYEILHEKVKDLSQVDNDFFTDVVSRVYTQRDLGVTREETLLRVLGRGGSKKAVEIEGGRALILPNTDVDDFIGIMYRWKRMVDEEVAMSDLLIRLGLLSLSSKRVQISFSLEGKEGVIPAYLTESFASLAQTKGWFIIDTKNRQSSTWKFKTKFLFGSQEERLKEENWDSVVNMLLSDVAKIYFHNLPAFGDALNIAIVKNLPQKGVSPYEVRYFGFDFSSKWGAISQPKIREKPPEFIDPNTISRLLNGILDSVFFYEFGRTYDYDQEGLPFRNLKDKLVEKYTPMIIEKIKALP